MAEAGREQVGSMVLGAWDAFIEQAETVDLSRPSRLDGWRAQEICVHLGCWDDHTALADLIASARASGAGTPPDVDAVNARVTAAHRDASRDEVLAALRRNREATARYLAEEPVGLDTALTVSVVGRRTSSPSTAWIWCPAVPLPRPRQSCSRGSLPWPMSPAAWPRRSTSPAG
jgi:hypothetical protein